MSCGEVEGKRELNYALGNSVIYRGFVDGMHKLGVSHQIFNQNS